MTAALLLSSCHWYSVAEGGNHHSHSVFGTNLTYSVSHIVFGTNLAYSVLAVITDPVMAVSIVRWNLF